MNLGRVESDAVPDAKETEFVRPWQQTNSRSFVACLAVGLAEVDPFAVSTLLCALCGYSVLVSRFIRPLSLADRGVVLVDQENRPLVCGALPRRRPGLYL